MLNPYISTVVNTAPIGRKPCGHCQHRTNGLEALLFATGNQGQADVLLAQKRRGTVRLAGRHLFTQPPHGGQQSHELCTQGACWLRSRLGRLHGE